MSLLVCTGAEEDLSRAARRRWTASTSHVEPGEIVGLLGPNGAGKTSTFRMACGLVTPTAGRVILRGKDVTNWPMFKRARQGMGYLPQDDSVFKKLTVEQNLYAILEYLNLPRRERLRRAGRAARPVRPRRQAPKQYAGTLSGGERRRLENRPLPRQPAGADPARRAVHRHRPGHDPRHPGHHPPAPRRRHQHPADRPPRARDAHDSPTAATSSARGKCSSPATRRRCSATRRPRRCTSASGSTRPASSKASNSSRTRTNAPPEHGRDRLARPCRDGRRHDPLASTPVGGPWPESRTVSGGILRGDVQAVGRGASYDAVAPVHVVVKKHRRSLNRAGFLPGFHGGIQEKSRGGTLSGPEKEAINDGVTTCSTIGPRRGSRRPARSPGGLSVAGSAGSSASPTLGRSAGDHEPVPLRSRPPGSPGGRGDFRAKACTSAPRGKRNATSGSRANAPATTSAIPAIRDWYRRYWKPYCRHRRAGAHPRHEALAGVRGPRRSAACTR